mmetsp:Transcript_27109/g.49338  ORF Transcript_27109/g.49338 Transcript_27109/m.49338 type:complete len:638 (-) Transcript_27109:126-2039(-)
MKTSKTLNFFQQADSSPSTSKVAGIDLGTTNSLISILEGGKSILIPNSEDGYLTASAVAYRPDGECLVGNLAKRQALMNPENTFLSFKRFLGRKFAEIQALNLTAPYKLMPDKDDNVRFWCPVLERLISPEEVSAQVLRRLIDDASKYVGEPVTRAVITHPAYFNTAQLQATRDAAKIAGIEVMHMLSEPTAAGLAYGIESGQKESNHVIVFDLGGGTFDISLMMIDPVTYSFEVEATSGDTELGGDDFTAALTEDVRQGCIDLCGLEVANLPKSIQRCNDKAETGKIALSTSEETTINIPFLTQEYPTCEVTLTRASFENRITTLLDRCQTPIDEVLAANNSLEAPVLIQDVLLVGGSTRIPAVRRFAASILDKEPLTPGNPDELVARGAALFAAHLAGESTVSITLNDLVPLTIGVETAGGLVESLVPKNTPLPQSATKGFRLLSDSRAPGVLPINIVQGERPLAAENKLLGVVELPVSVQASSSPNEPTIEVTFRLDRDGILRVTATDLTTAIQRELVIENSSNLDAAEVERLTIEAEKNAIQDQARVLVKTKLNNATQVLTDALSESSSAADATTLANLKQSCTELEAAAQSESTKALPKSEFLLKEINEVLDKLRAAIARLEKNDAGDSEKS